jgi:hypothetical protein
MTDRAVSTTVGYVIGLGITVLLVGGLIIAGTTFVGDQRQRASDTQLRVIGQQVAADLAQADRLVQASQSNGSVSTVTIDSTIPETVAGTTYDVEILSRENASIQLSTTNPSTSVNVTVRNQTAIGPGYVDGGEYTVVYNTTTDRLEVVDDG